MWVAIIFSEVGGGGIHVDHLRNTVKVFAVAFRFGVIPQMVAELLRAQVGESALGQLTHESSSDPMHDI